MPIKLRNANLVPKTDPETVEVLDLHIPVAGDLPFGAQIEWFDLMSAQEEGRVGGAEFMMRALCLFTRRLPKREWVNYDWLARQHLDADEMTELFTGISRLMDAMRPDEAGGEGNAKEKGKTTKKK